MYDDTTAMNYRPAGSRYLAQIQFELSNIHGGLEEVAIGFVTNATAATAHHKIRPSISPAQHAPLRTPKPTRTSGAES